MILSICKIKVIPISFIGSLVLLIKNKNTLTGLRNIMAIIEARSNEVIAKWMNFFGEVRYFC